MSWGYAIEYMLKQLFLRGEEITTGDTSIVRMHAHPPAKPFNDSAQEILLEIVCDSDGKPQSAQMRTV